jgi:hypothetical protein
MIAYRLLQPQQPPELQDMAKPIAWRRRLLQLFEKPAFTAAL